MSWNGLKKLIPLVWGAAVLAGFGFMMRYELKPGTITNPVIADWPADAPLPLVPGRANLVMFAHPRCPCSRASLAELVEAVTQSGGPDKVAVTVLFSIPSDDRAAWQDSALWRSAAAFPGVRVAADLDGRLATRFGAAVSGHVLCFDPAGRLRFSGGITGARGQQGENAGLDAVIALARGGEAAAALGKTPVYGCALAKGTDVAAASPPLAEKEKAP